MTYGLPELATAWDSFHANSDNHAFHPSDELVRFVNSHLCRRAGPDEVIDLLPGAQGSRVVDIGCGIGRNLAFGIDMGLEMYGNDLSPKAVELAREWMNSKSGPMAGERIISSDVRYLPWENYFFAHAICDGALNSMPFEVAQAGVAEISRVMQPGGFFYCSMVSGDETGRDPGFCSEVVIEMQYGSRRVRSYFNKVKIIRLLEPLFAIESCRLVQVTDTKTGKHQGRWHVVSRCR